MTSQVYYIIVLLNITTWNYEFNESINRYLYILIRYVMTKTYLSLEYNDEHKISNKTALFANAIVI